MINGNTELIAHIVHTGYDPQFGARPIKRMIQKELLNELSRQIIAGTIENTGRTPATNDYKNTFDPNSKGWKLEQFGFAAETEARNVDLPAFGRPIRPASAISFSRSHRAFSSPGQPLSARRGARLVELL